MTFAYGWIIYDLSFFVNKMRKTISSPLLKNNASEKKKKHRYIIFMYFVAFLIIKFYL